MIRVWWTVVETRTCLLFFDCTAVVRGAGGGPTARLGPTGGTIREAAGRGVHSTKVTVVIVLGQTVLENVDVTVAVSIVYLKIIRVLVSLS
jgi:hypothetical protein